MRRRLALALGVLVLGVLTGCGQAPWEDTLHDFEGATIDDPDEVTVWNNVDLHPNIARSCVDGLAFVTTTRDYTAVMRVPEWDEHCAAITTTEKEN